MKTWNKKLLSAAVTGCMTFLTCSSLPLTYASDIEIYRSAEQGTARILLMLDTSGSMGISSLVLPNNNKFGSPGDIAPNVTLCDRVDVSEHYQNRNNTTKLFEWAYNLKSNNKTSIRKEVTIGSTTIPYYVRGCTNGTITQYDRLSRLKDAILPLLAGNQLRGDVAIGLGQFSSKTELTIGDASNKLTDSHSGRIMVPVAKLDTEQRIKLARQIASIKSLDTTTNEDGTPNPALKLSSNNYPNVTKAAGGTPTAHAYAEAGAYMMGRGTGSGGKNSGKVGTIYDGYMVKQKNQVDGQVYFICTVGNGGTTSALGATVRQCPSNWPEYNNNNVTGTVIYRPKGPSLGNLPKCDNTWCEVTLPNFKTYVKDTLNITMNNLWDGYKALPVGWRFDGWMRVEHEPMDIEPIVGTVWGYPDNINGLVSYRTSPFVIANDGTENNIGGFAYSASEVQNGNVYHAGGSTNSCDGNGIYFLTDGAPNSTKDTMAQTIMNHSLGRAHQFTGKPLGAEVLTSPALQSSLFANETGGWEYIGEYAKKLFDKNSNPGGMSIRTAVVGFGSSFADLKNTNNCEAIKSQNPSGYNVDAYNACKWGGDDFGAGGFYYAENVADIQNSIINFVKKVEVNIDPVLTGAPTLPIDSLNPTTLQPYGYYSTIEPNVTKPYQLWLGNLNKYRVLNGELYSASSLEKLLTEAGTLNQIASGFWDGGTLGKLNLQHTETKTNRIVYTNRKIDGSAAASTNSLSPVTLDSLLSPDASLGYLKNDPKKNYWLNALGYRVGETDVVNSLSDLEGKSQLRQLGAVLHSTPILLTQEGKVNVDLTTTGRKDYLLYGSTQGVLHVVDTSTGEETFSFIPSEMMENQPKGFIENSLTGGGSENLFYGIDGAWTAYTQYVTKKDGTLTVGDSGRSSEEEIDKDDDDKDTTGNVSTKNNLKGKQWVYGGLRMGGRSYYGLDLSDLSAPKLKLHIDPSAKDAKAELQRMGQSWSKPTIGYVNWGGQRKLVMFVGGGYDAKGDVDCKIDTTKTNKGYECPTYHQTNKVGAGVYMFDAENGDLLWWSSSDQPAGSDSKIRFTANTDLQYSVASQINAIDRNGDGLIDHLYFGDLAGQAFRVDLNNALKVSADSDENSQDVIAAKDNFGKRVVTLFSEMKASVDGLKPRFYEMPSVSIHTDNVPRANATNTDADKPSGARFAVVSFSSGNRSAPLTENSPKDGVFVAFDKDVTNANLFKDNFKINSENLALKDLVLNTGVSYRENGWRSYFSNKAGSFKGMNDLYTLDNMLYVNVFHKDGDGTSGQCGAGVRGDSYLFQYCLPYGKCSFYGPDTKEVNKVKIGVGILGTGLGNGYNNVKNQLGLIVNRDETLDCTKKENKDLPECQLFDNSARLKQLRWYETQ